MIVRNGLDMMENELERLKSIRGWLSFVNAILVEAFFVLGAAIGICLVAVLVWQIVI